MTETATVIKRLLLWPLGVLLALALLWLLWSLVAYRDIPVATLDARYGDEALAVADIDGVAVRYRVQGDGPALLLIHSHYFNMRMWDDWIPTLAQYFKVIRFDMTSHGLTGPEPSGDYSMQRDLELIRGLLDHLGIERVGVVGSSLGGNMAFHLAAQEPDRVEALVLMNSGGLPRTGARGTGGTIPGWVDYMTYITPTSAFRRFLQWMIIDDSLVTDEQVTQFHQMFRREGNRFAEFTRLRSFDVGDPVPVLAAIRAPVLIMWGADNPQLPVAQVDKFEALLENAAFVDRIIYEETGHVLPLEQPRDGSTDLRDFLLALRQ